VADVSPRRVDALAQAMGAGGVSKSTVSKPCGYIVERGSAFLDRPLTGDRSYVRLDANYLETRQGGRIVPGAALRQAFDQSDRAPAGETWRKVADRLRPR